MDIREKCSSALLEVIGSPPITGSPLHLLSGWFLETDLQGEWSIDGHYDTSSNPPFHSAAMAFFMYWRMKSVGGKLETVQTDIALAHLHNFGQDGLYVNRRQKIKCKITKSSDVLLDVLQVQALIGQTSPWLHSLTRFSYLGAVFFTRTT